MDNKKGILLESGTNEVEIIEFTIGGVTFGINVAKVREIMPYSKVEPVPNSHPCVKGIFKPREMVMTVIDLPRYLNLPLSEDETKNLYIIANFNEIHTAFIVHNVVGIHRITWGQIEKPDKTLYGGNEGLVVGVVKLHGKLIMILDFEKILHDISPKTGIQVSEIKDMGSRTTSDRPILIAEDSEMLTHMLKDCLHEAGYTNLITAPNGQEAWEIIQKYNSMPNSDIQDHIACVITDIEMPQMDGHRLTKLIKDDENLKKLPVIIFSSLINDEMKRKGQKLGANAQISKPQIGNLIGLIDTLIL